MPRDVDGIERDAARVDLETADEIAADMARGPEQNRRRLGAEPALAVAHQRLL